VPLIAVHLFVFYFGILADDTPPVGLAAYAAAAISGGDPIKTGVQGFAYDIRTALLPFLFIFNTELLLIDVGPVQGDLRLHHRHHGHVAVRRRHARRRRTQTVALLLIALFLDCQAPKWWESQG
jgi:TRAP-type uncharacterized transport system fused permease subunit